MLDSYQHYVTTHMKQPVAAISPTVYINVQRTSEHVRRARVPNGPDIVTGMFAFEVAITAVTDTIYLPVSIASGKKPTGFVYEIEGTAPGAIVTTDISCKGENGITQITLGTLVYCKIPVGMTAIFRIHVQVRGRVGKSYRIVMRQIRFKQDPSDARYQELVPDISSTMLKFV